METYSIIDLEGYAVAIRDGAASSFSEEYTENLDNFITINQVINIIKKKNLGKDNEGHFLIDQNIFDEIFEDVREWLYGSAVCKLASQNLIECAWDNDSNEMVFWLPDSKNTEISASPKIGRAHV